MHSDDSNMDSLSRNLRLSLRDLMLMLLNTQEPLTDWSPESENGRVEPSIMQDQN